MKKCFETLRLQLVPMFKLTVAEDLARRSGVVGLGLENRVQAKSLTMRGLLADH